VLFIMSAVEIPFFPILFFPLLKVANLIPGKVPIFLFFLINGKSNS
jgi:hypothetical protein